MVLDLHDHEDLVVGAVLILPVSGFAQEATLSGTVTDTTGGVLPGVTLTAVHEASGNTFEGVTDEPPPPKSRAKEKEREAQPASAS